MVDPEDDRDPEDEEGPILDELFTAGGMVDGVMIDAQAPPEEKEKDSRAS
jgi:hypothetical protein